MFITLAYPQTIHKPSETPGGGFFEERQTMRLNAVYIIGGEYYKVQSIDSGQLRPEDARLYRAVKVRWSGNHYWECYDDADYLIDDDRRIVAKEVGWCLRREVMR